MFLKSAQIRKIHRFLAPILILPIILTLVTGSLFQIANLTGRGGDFYWLLQVHKGNWTIVNLEVIYPFLNSLGLLVMAVTGFSMWSQLKRPRSRKQPSGPTEDSTSIG